MEQDVILDENTEDFLCDSDCDNIEDFCDINKVKNIDITAEEEDK